MKPYPFLGDVGTLILIDVGTDVSTATDRKVKYLKPNGVRGEWDGVLSGTNFITYTTIAGDLDSIGEWRVQVKIVMPTGSWHGEIARFTVVQPIIL